MWTFYDMEGDICFCCPDVDTINIFKIEMVVESELRKLVFMVS